MDKITTKHRSWNMSRIRCRDTRPELKVRKYLHSRGYRYRINYKITGRPDIVFPNRKIAIFVHGCFWHRHGCKNSVIPKTNTAFWKRKLVSNVLRDEQVRERLRTEDWKVLTVWECEVEKDIDLVCRWLRQRLSNVATSRKTVDSLRLSSIA